MRSINIRKECYWNCSWAIQFWTITCCWSRCPNAVFISRWKQTLHWCSWSTPSFFSWTVVTTAIIFSVSWWLARTERTLKTRLLQRRAKQRHVKMVQLWFFKSHLLLVFKNFRSHHLFNTRIDEIRDFLIFFGSMISVKMGLQFKPLFLIKVKSYPKTIWWKWAGWWMWSAMSSGLRFLSLCIILLNSVLDSAIVSLMECASFVLNIPCVLK